jgi:phosphatidylserine/phosphatidylglycerophosphate/cardiolipin synthase-like enzyme
MTIGDVDLYLGPKQAGAPDDLRAAIIGFIYAAERRLDVAVQELDSRPIAEAIVRARQRGVRVRVRVVLETDYLRARRTAPDPWQPGGTLEPNRQIHLALMRAGIHVRTDLNSHIFHHKFAVRDGAAVLTGSTNFTDTGTTRNLNHVLIMRDERIARAYGREFRQLARGQFGKASPRAPSPDDIEVSGLRLRVAFAPDHSPEMEIMKQMLKARESIHFAAFTFAQSSGIDDTMIALARHGVPIRGALDALQANQRWAATHPIHRAGVDLHIARRSPRLGKLHHKLMVLDRRVVIAGSFNYTDPANRLNDENIVVIGRLGVKGAVLGERFWGSAFGGRRRGGRRGPGGRRERGAFRVRESATRVPDDLGARHGRGERDELDELRELDEARELAERDEPGRRDARAAS